MKPTCKLIGSDSNIFNLIGIASRALNRANQQDQAKEMSQRCLESSSYDKALSIILEYVDQEQEEMNDLDDEDYYEDEEEESEED